MENNQKQLLLADICEKFPYGLKVKFEEKGDSYTEPITALIYREDGIRVAPRLHDSLPFESVKPYLRSLMELSKTEIMDLMKIRFGENDERVANFDQFNRIGRYHGHLIVDFTFNVEDEDGDLHKYSTSVDFGKHSSHQSDSELQYFNENKIDWRGLIGKGIALQAPKGMYLTI